MSDYELFYFFLVGGGIETCYYIVCHAYAWYTLIRLEVIMGILGYVYSYTNVTLIAF